jgi:hypothetical protein
METQNARLGIDIGGVLISRPHDGEDTVFFGESLDAALETPPMEGMFDAVSALATLFAGRVWIVSKCGRRIQDRSRLWLDHHHFHDRTGVPADHVHFCRDRAGKVPICRDLGITHFIDDRLDVLGHLDGVVPNRYLFGPGPGPTPTGIVRLETWRDAPRVLGATQTATSIP